MTETCWRSSALGWNGHLLTRVHITLSTDTLKQVKRSIPGPETEGEDIEKKHIATLPPAIMKKRWLTLLIPQTHQAPLMRSELTRLSYWRQGAKLVTMHTDLLKFGLHYLG